MIHEQGVYQKYLWTWMIITHCSVTFKDQYSLHKTSHSQNIRNMGFSDGFVDSGHVLYLHEQNILVFLILSHFPNY